MTDLDPGDPVLGADYLAPFARVRAGPGEVTGGIIQTLPQSNHGGDIIRGCLGADRREYTQQKKKENADLEE